MRRAILSSVLIIGAALAVVFAGGSFSAFTDEENISGTATAAILDFELQGDGSSNSTGVNEAAGNETLTISFNGVDSPCPTGGASAVFAPGDTCKIDVNLTRNPATIAQQLAANLSVSAFSVGGVSDNDAGDLDPSTGVIGLDCDGATGTDWTVSYAFDDSDGSTTHMPAGVQDTNQQIDVSVALAGTAGNDCQGDALGTVAIKILSSQDTVTPHSTTD
jgi:predicted ribosomally synthesized peptide with SipW-like signal peptide